MLIENLNQIVQRATLEYGTYIPTFRKMCRPITYIHLDADCNKVNWVEK